MSRELTANAQTQANAVSARPFNILAIDWPARVPSWFWKMDEPGDTDDAYSNVGDESSRIVRYNGTRAAGRHGSALRLVPPPGWTYWGLQSAANFDYNGETVIVAGVWLKRESGVTDWRIMAPYYGARSWFYWYPGRFSVYVKVGGTPVIRHFMPGVYGESFADWTRVLYKCCISGGNLLWDYWINDEKKVAAYNSGAADEFDGPIDGSMRFLYCPGNDSAAVYMDELIWAPGWDMTDDEAEMLYDYSLRFMNGPSYHSDAARDLGKHQTDACVVDWGQLSLPGGALGSQQDAALFPLAAYTPQLHLADNDLRDIFFSPYSPLHEKCLLHQFWDDASLSWPDDAVTLYEGTLGSIAGGAAQRFRDRDVTISLSIIDRFKTLLDRDVGFIASRDVFDDVLEEDEGRSIPLVYGKAGKVKAVCIKGPQVGRLMQGCSKDDATLYIEGGEKFPQGEAVVVRIGFEYIKGTFSGNTFTVAKRGCGPSSDGSYVSLNCTGHVVDQEYGTDFRKLTISSPPGINDQYVGMWLGAPVGTVYQTGEVTYQTVSPGNPYTDYLPPQLAPHDALQWRQILHYDSDNGAVEINLPYLREDTRTLTADDRYLASGVQVIIQNGATLKIGSLPAPHRAGVEVFEVLDECIYALNAAPSRAVKAVYFHGLKGEWRLPSDYTDNLVDAGGGLLGMVNISGPGALSFSTPAAPSGDAMHAGAWSGLIGAVFPSDEAGFQEIPTAFYSTDLDDDTWDSDLGTDVTTVTFRMLPVHVPFFRPGGLDIWADLEGVDDDQDSLIENPADVIEDILVNRLGVDGALIDATSFAAAKSSSNWIRFAGAIERRMDGRRLVSEVAFQARCRVRFEPAKIYLDYLRNAPGTSVSPAVTKALAVEDRFELHWEDPGQVVNELEFTWRDSERLPRSERVNVDESIEAFGRRQSTASFYLHQSYAQAKQVAAFWVNRWAWPWRRGTVRGFLPFLPFQRGDTVEITNADWGLDAQKAEVLDLFHRPGAAHLVDEIAVAFRMPLRPGCASSCETFCETGCETDCENWCQTSCELSCQSACESACQALCKLACQTVVQHMDGGGCFACQVGNRVGVVGGDGPRDDWEQECSGCQTCQGSCVDSCQTGCETSCQENCTAGPACETSCEISCEVSCEVSCEESCEPGCEVGCEVSCEIPCEVECETGCVSTCQSACQSACQGCESCQSGCISSCEACQTSCETACQQSCQVGSCTVGSCETSCEEGNCEVSCEVGGCELACEVGQQ